MTTILLRAVVIGSFIRRASCERDPDPTPVPSVVPKASNFEEFFTDDHGHDAAGLVASAKCDKSSGQCYVVDKNGHMTLDNERTIDDYRKIKTKINNNVNDMHLTLINLAAKQADQMSTVETTVQEQVKQRMVLHHLTTLGTFVAIVLLIALALGAKKIYQDKLSPNAAVRAEARRTWQQINEIYEQNPEHCVLLMRVMLKDNTISWCRKHLADLEAGQLSRQHDQIRAEELERLMKNQARQSQLFQGHTYMSVPASAPHSAVSGVNS